MKLEEWFKIKKYPHIGKPITIKDYDWVKAYVEKPEKVRSHSFLPLIHNVIIKRRFRADTTVNERNPSGKRKRKKENPKVRDIFFFSHFDSLILSKYNELISADYESYLRDKSFNTSIVAYRKIPTFQNSRSNKCNIDFAKTAFEFIKNNETRKTTVIIADITSFFDNLDHKILKKQWAKILNKTTLPNDHYNIFKTLTKIKYIDGEKLFRRNNKTIFIKRGIPNNPKKTEFIKKPIKLRRYFKEKNATHYCSKTEFIKNHLNIIISKNNEEGIPQGSPISATLANIYMLDFDQQLYDYTSEIGGFYQRYSDDLIIICEQTQEDQTIKFIRERVENLVKLNIKPSKTKIFHFEFLDNKLSGFEVDESTKIVNQNKTLEYLGFSFNGEKVMIKSSAFSKFYRSMKSTYKRSTSLALYSKNPDHRIFKSRLYKKFTHRGSKRKFIFRPSKENSTIYNKTKKYYWGNYISYINKANETMKSINHDNSIKRQSRKFWSKFHCLMKHHKKRLNLVS